MRRHEERTTKSPRDGGPSANGIVEKALYDLSQKYPRLHELVRLRFEERYSLHEAAVALKMEMATAHRAWCDARRILRRHVQSGLAV